MGSHSANRWGMQGLISSLPPLRASTCAPAVYAFATEANSLDWNHLLHKEDSNCGYFQQLYDRQARTNLPFIDDWHPLSFASKRYDANNPSPFELPKMPLEDKQRWRDAMNIKLKELESKGTFEIVPRSEANEEEVVKTMWALKRKRTPDGTITRWKA